MNTNSNASTTTLGITWYQVEVEASGEQITGTEQTGQRERSGDETGGRYL